MYFRYTDSVMGEGDEHFSSVSMIAILNFDELD